MIPLCILDSENEGPDYGYTPEFGYLSGFWLVICDLYLSPLFYDFILLGWDTGGARGCLANSKSVIKRKEHAETCAAPSVALLKRIDVWVKFLV